MKKMLLIVCCLLLWTSCAAAAPYHGEVKWMKLPDGALCGEVWYNDRLFYRLTLLLDGARPVTGFADGHTIFIAPDLRNGCFVLTLQ